MQLVPVSASTSIPDEEPLQIDKLLEVKNWSMQTRSWRFLNVLFDHLNVQQMNYKCKNSKTVFENLCKLLRLGLMNPRELKKDEKGMTIVKTYILKTFFPKAVNTSLQFLTPELSLQYLEILTQAFDIERHHKHYKQTFIDHCKYI